ncbi:MAG: GAF domain-containing protein [Chloroflexota bacterium]
MTAAGTSPMAAESIQPAARGERRGPPVVVAIADVETNAQDLVQHVLLPAGLKARTERADGPPADVLVVDVTQLRGDPLASLRSRRQAGDEAPAIVLAAHIPPARLRDLFHLNVRDILLKPYKPAELIQVISEVSESRAGETSTQILGSRLEAAREQARRYAEEIRLLGDIGRAVATLGDLSLILTRVAEAASFITNAEETNIYLADPGTNELILRACKAAGERNASLLRLRVDDTLVGEVFRSGRPVLQQPSAEGIPVKVQTGFLVQSLIMVPIRVREQPVGVLGVYNPGAARPFDEHHLTLLVALADWASMALEHAALLRKVQGTGGRTQELAAVSQTLMEGLDHAATVLEGLARGSAGPLTKPQSEVLRKLVHALQQLRSLPVAILPEEEAEHYVDVPAMIDEVLGELQLEAERRGLELKAERLGPLPLLPADRSRLRQVIDGLISASIRRTEQGQVLVRSQPLRLSGGRPDKRVTVPPRLRLEDGMWAIVSIADTSPGLSEDTQYALTAPKADPDAGKTGPGLSMGEIRMIAESLGGHIWHEQGAEAPTITLVLPLS